MVEQQVAIFERLITGPGVDRRPNEPGTRRSVVGWIRSRWHSPQSRGKKKTKPALVKMQKTRTQTGGRRREERVFPSASWCVCGRERGRVLGFVGKNQTEWRVIGEKGEGRAGGLTGWLGQEADGSS